MQLPGEFSPFIEKSFLKFFTDVAFLTVVGSETKVERKKVLSDLRLALC